MDVSIRLLTAAIFLLLQIPVSLSSTPPLNSTKSPLCHPNQSFALLQFKNHFVTNKSASYLICDLYSFPNIDSWSEDTNCCLWEGVECDESSGNVIGLHLRCLHGRIPTNSSLFQLSHLQTLVLSNNDFKGIPVPFEVGHLVNLKRLDISNSNFSGIIPPQISHLSNLISLNVVGNYHDFGNGYLIFDSLTFERLAKNLSHLKRLTLGNVNMSAVNLKLFLNISTSLESLDLFDCLLLGKFPANVLKFVNLKYFSMLNHPKLTISLPNSNWSGPLESLSLFNTSFSAEYFYSLVNLKSLNSLFLVNCGLTGPIPSFISNLTQIINLALDDNDITGEIPTFLSNLKHLTSLSLSRNNLTGQVPDLFGNLPELTHLYLYSNNLEGHLPSSIFSHPQLSELYLENNEFVSLPSEVTGISKLTGLFLQSNKLTGSIPTWLFNLSSLIVLALSDNQLTGEIPEFLSKSLESIYLEQNMLCGSFPESMFQLSNLTSLFLSSNCLLFGIREIEGFQNLKNLCDLDLSSNNLSISTPNNVDIKWPMLEYLYCSSCNITEFPMFLRTQDKLKQLDLSNNNIQGDIPQWMMKVGEKTLNYLNLSHNHLTGTLQLSWQELEVLDLHSNMLQGLLPIPPPNVKYFFISENKFFGEMSPLICNMSSLQILDLSSNNLSGSLPSCLGNLTTVLSVLNLQRNNFHGTIPITYAKGCVLSNLNLQGNKLEGKIPRSLVNCKDLEVLDLGHNMFSDEFPELLKTLPKLRVLVLRSNKLHGPLPNLATNDSFSKIQVIDLSNNSLDGQLPNLENLRAMVNVDESEDSKYIGISVFGRFETNYDYSIVLSMKGNMIEMQKILHVFTSIDLSNNAFEGEILFDIGKLISLKGLNLSHNILRGQIPASIGKLKNLEWLDLSSNELIGEIPMQLVDLTSLAILNLSYNQLVGHIPEEKQFNTFTTESYKGNLGLCGSPLQRECRDEESEPPVPSIDDENSSFFDPGFGWKSVFIGYGCGMVFGIGAGYTMFQYRRPRWLLVIIEEKLRLRPQRPRRSWRRNTRKKYKFLSGLFVHCR